MVAHRVVVQVLSSKRPLNRNRSSKPQELPITASSGRGMYREAECDGVDENQSGKGEVALYLPLDVVPFEVDYSKDADFGGSNSVEDAVRKPAQNGMPD